MRPLIESILYSSLDIISPLHLWHCETRNKLSAPQYTQNTTVDQAQDSSYGHSGSTHGKQEENNESLICGSSEIWPGKCQVSSVRF